MKSFLYINKTVRVKLRNIIDNISPLDIVIDSNGNHFLVISLDPNNLDGKCLELESLITGSRLSHSLSVIAEWRPNTNNFKIKDYGKE